MAAPYFSKLNKDQGTFSKMMTNGFGVVTVMNAKVYDCPDFSSDEVKDQTPYKIVHDLSGELCTLDTLKIANVTIEGPSKTVSGGQYANPLIKFGKSARLEMQDALGNAKAIDVLGGGIRETTTAKGADNPTVGLHFGEDFNKPVTIVGDSFFIDRVTGQQVPVTIVFYQFLPDSIFNLTQDAEGDATVFDMNGDLLTTTVTLGDENGSGEGGGVRHGVFYSILDPKEVKATE